MNQNLDVSRYRGQWGGKTPTGEEIWWTEPNSKIMAQKPSALARFKCDVRQHFLLKFLYRAISSLKTPSKQPVIIDFGCGTGGTTLNFSSILSLPITGFDIFPTQLQIGKHFAEQYKNASQFQALDTEGNISLPAQSVDIIYTADVLGHVPHVSKTLSDWRRVLKPGGFVVLFTEAAFSPEDTSLGARLARDGYDMVASVPEHISLHPRANLEEMFNQSRFEVLARYSANVGHFFFFPKDYLKLLENSTRWKNVYRLARVWNRISKILPFYPWPFQAMRLLLTYLKGEKAYGSSYFYLLRAR